MPSFDDVNYSLRPNKNVERKLIFDALAALGTDFSLNECTYVGLGSLWFVDFLLAHRMLRIDRLISIERAQHADRANFNRPYRCIDVLAGDTSAILPQLDYTRRMLAWLDYDTGLDGPILSDAEFLLQHAPVGSILLFTSNAHAGRLGEPGNRLVKLRELAHGLVSPDTKEGDLQRTSYPRTLGALLYRKMKSSLINSGRSGVELLPVFNFVYSDNAPMVTVGGIVADSLLRERYDACGISERFPYITGEVQYAIKVPNLTSREKFALDRLLPSESLPTKEEVKEILGFELGAAELEGYHRFYRVYPVFGEMLI